jgi:restriction system protein
MGRRRYWGRRRRGGGLGALISLPFALVALTVRVCFVLATCVIAMIALPLRAILALGGAARQAGRERAVQLDQVDTLNGLAFEHYVAELLRHRGFQAQVTKASGDLGVDIIASQAGQRWAIQAKRYTGAVSRRAVSDAVAGVPYYQCTGAMVITNRYFTPDAQALAHSTGCILVDRNQLAAWIQDWQAGESRPASGRSAPTISPRIVLAVVGSILLGLWLLAAVGASPQAGLAIVASVLIGLWLLAVVRQ